MAPVAIIARRVCEGRTPSVMPMSVLKDEAARAGRAAGGFVLVGPARFELATFRPPDGRANQAALRPDEADTYRYSGPGQAGKNMRRISGQPAGMRGRSWPEALLRSAARPRPDPRHVAALRVPRSGGRSRAGSQIGMASGVRGSFGSLGLGGGRGSPRAEVSGLRGVGVASGCQAPAPGRLWAGQEASTWRLWSATLASQRGASGIMAASAIAMTCRIPCSRRTFCTPRIVSPSLCRAA